MESLTDIKCGCLHRGGAMARLKKGLRLIIPNGSLLDKTTILIKRADYFFHFTERSFEASILENKLLGKLYRARPMDIPGMILDNYVDVGITGYDWYKEWCYENGFNENKLKIISEFAYTKHASKSMDILILCRKGSIVDPAVIKRKKNKGEKIIGLSEKFGIIDRKGINFLAEYPHIGEQYFPKSRMIFSHGSSEAKLLIGKKYHYCIVGRDKGETIKQNEKLKVATVLFQSPVVLLAKKLTPEIKRLSKQLEGAYNAEFLRILDYNVESNQIKSATLKILKDMGYITANEIPFTGNDREGCSIRVAINDSDSDELNNKLQEAGADFLIITKPEQVITR